MPAKHFFRSMQIPVVTTSASQCLPDRGGPLRCCGCQSLISSSLRPTLILHPLRISCTSNLPHGIAITFYLQYFFQYIAAPESHVRQPITSHPRSSRSSPLYEFLGRDFASPNPTLQHQQLSSNCIPFWQSAIVISQHSYDNGRASKFVVIVLKVY